MELFKEDITMLINNSKFKLKSIEQIFNLPKDIKTIGYELKGKYFDLLEEYNKSNNQLIIEKDA